MFTIQSIGSLDGPHLEPYRSMRRQLEHRQRRIFVAEGAKVVCRLLASPFEVISVLLPEDRLPQVEPLLRERPELIPVYVAPKSELERMTGYSMYQGVLAVGRVPTAPSLEAIASHQPEPLLLAAIDGVSNAENTGVIVRNCVAFGVHALIVGETSSSAFMRRAVRCSMGAVFQLPIVEVDQLVATLGQLRQRGIRCVAAHPRGSRPLFAADFRPACCLVFGSEGPGISESILAACDETLEIPMHSTVDSLNVGSASAVFFAEALRQRQSREG